MHVPTCSDLVAIFNENFQAITGRRPISETVPDGPRLLLIINKKSYIGFQISWKLLTLDDIEGHWQPVQSAFRATAGLLVGCYYCLRQILPDFWLNNRPGSNIFWLKCSAFISIGMYDRAMQERFSRLITPVHLSHYLNAFPKCIKRTPSYRRLYFYF